MYKQNYNVTLFNNEKQNTFFDRILLKIQNYSFVLIQLEINDVHDLFHFIKFRRKLITYNYLLSYLIIKRKHCYKIENA